MQVDNELIIETPEHVQLRFVMASVGTRFLAALIDHLIQGAAIITILILVYAAYNVFDFFKSAGNWAIAAVVFVIGGLILLIIGYFTLFESLWSGQTPGKRWMKLRVIREDGRAVGFFEALVRNMLRVIDLLPSGYAIGVVTIIVSDQSRRIGDYVAGTVVVKERASEAPSLSEVLDRHERETRRNGSNRPALQLDIRQLTKQEFLIVEKFLARRNEIPQQSRPHVAARIAIPLLQKFQVMSVESYEAFLEDVDRQYKAHAKYLVD